MQLCAIEIMRVFENVENSLILNPCKVGNFWNFDAIFYGVKVLYKDNNSAIFFQNRTIPGKKVRKFVETVKYVNF